MKTAAQDNKNSTCTNAHTHPPTHTSSMTRISAEDSSENHSPVMAPSQVPPPARWGTLVEWKKRRRREGALHESACVSDRTARGLGKLKRNQNMIIKRSNCHSALESRKPVVSVPSRPSKVGSQPIKLLVLAPRRPLVVVVTVVAAVLPLVMLLLIAASNVLATRGQPGEPAGNHPVHLEATGPGRPERGDGIQLEASSSSAPNEAEPIKRHHYEAPSGKSSAQSNSARDHNSRRVLSLRLLLMDFEH